MGERIHHRGDDVKGEKDESQQADVAVKTGRQEPRPARTLHAERRQDPEHHDDAQQDERDDARAARRVPEEGVVQDPPETATPALDDELTCVDEDWRLDELAEVEVVVLVLTVDAVDDEAVVPGRVCALTTPSTPTPPMAAKATPAVRRLRSRMAESLALIRASVPVVLCCMGATVPGAYGTSL
jgi:hypothetical protein